MGLAIIGAMALGQWDEAATVAFLYGLSESLEALSLEHARRSIRALLELAPATCRADRRGRIGKAGAGESASAGRSCPGARRRHDSGRRRGGSRPLERRPEDDHGRVGPGSSRGGRPGLRRHGQWRRDAGGHGIGPGGRRVDLAGGGPGPGIQAGRAPIERRISRFAAVYTPIVIGLSLLVMLVPPLLTLAGAGWSSRAWRSGASGSAAGWWCW